MEPCRTCGYRTCPSQVTHQPCDGSAARVDLAERTDRAILRVRRGIYDDILLPRTIKGRA